MKDIWHIHGAPLWMVHDFLSGRMTGLLGQSPYGVLTILYAVHPDLNVIEIERLLPASPDDLIRTETIIFRVDREKHEWHYTGVKINGATYGPSPMRAAYPWLRLLADRDEPRPDVIAEAK